MLDCVCQPRIFMMLDLCSSYSLIRIKEGKEYKMAFGTCYGQLKHWILPFSLTNAPGTSQYFLDGYIQPFIDNFAVCYLDDTLLCSTNKKDHQEHA